MHLFSNTASLYEQAFSQDLSTLLLVVESDTPELTKSASRKLLGMLSSDTDHFNSAYIPNDNEFFRRNGLLYLDTDELQTLSNDLSVAQPFIGRIAQQPSLTGFFSIFEDALKATDKGTARAADKTHVMPIDLSLAGRQDFTSFCIKRFMAKMPAFLGIVDCRKKKTFHQGVHHCLRPSSITRKSVPPKAQSKLSAKPRRTFRIPVLPAVKVWVTGEVGLEDDELAGISTGTFTASVFSVVLVLFILLVAYRSILLTIATLLTLALGMVFCGAFAAFAVTELNLISLAFAVSNIGLGVEYAIHFCLRYKDNLTATSIKAG